MDPTPAVFALPMSSASYIMVEVGASWTVTSHDAPAFRFLPQVLATIRKSVVGTLTRSSTTNPRAAPPLLVMVNTLLLVLSLIHI